MKIVCSLDLHFTNHLDHFVPLCDLLHATLFVYSSEDEKVLTTYYPKVQYRYIQQDQTMFRMLAEYADILITSTAETGEYLSMQTFLQTKKQLPYIFLPHGQSDKAYAASRMVTHAPYRFVYGKYMQEQLIEQGAVVSSQFLVGNFRLEYYQKHRSFFDKHIPRETFTKKQTILYAPTWNDHEHSSSIKQGFILIDTLARSFNVIIKLHPLTLRDQPGYYYAFEEKVKEYPHIWFASNQPCIYPILSASDAYLGDYSSIGYDYLYFNRPLFFLSPSTATKCEKGNKLHACGHIISSVEEIVSYMEQPDMLKNTREHYYREAFSEKDPFLIHKIEQLCTGNIYNE